MEPQAAEGSFSVYIVFCFSVLSVVLTVLSRHPISGDSIGKLTFLVPRDYLTPKDAMTLSRPVLLLFQYLVRQMTLVIHWYVCVPFSGRRITNQPGSQELEQILEGLDYFFSQPCLLRSRIWTISYCAHASSAGGRFPLGLGKRGSIHRGFHPGFGLQQLHLVIHSNHYASVGSCTDRVDHLRMPLSSAIGRRPILLLSSLLALGSSIWKARATTYGSFMGACVLNGIGAGPGEVCHAGSTVTNPPAEEDVRHYSHRS